MMADSIQTTTPDTVLVSGGTGFIGTWVIRELLRRGLPVVAIDQQEPTARWARILGSDLTGLRFHQVDLRQLDAVHQLCTEYSVTRMIHLAALLTPACQHDPWHGFQVNVAGSVGLLEVARRLGTQLRGFSYASSYAVYGPETGVPTASAAVIGSDTPTFYGAYKLAVDLIAEQYWRHCGVASLGIRPHVVYGPERDQGLTAGPSLAIRAALNGQSYQIGYRGQVSYDYVEDVAAAFVLAALETPPGAQVVDLPGHLASTTEVAATIAQVIPAAADLITVDGPEIPLNVPPRPDYLTRLFPDWKPSTLESGIGRTVEFYTSNPSNPSNQR